MVCNGMNIHAPLAPENTAEEVRRTEGRDEDYAIARLHLLRDGQRDNTHLCWFSWRGIVFSLAEASTAATRLA
jgi:hypothetical protein